MQDTIFRAYDIRGIVGSELTLDRIYDLGCAIAAYILHKNPHARTIALGMDGRIHSPLIIQDICRALCDYGFNVVMIGICTSPLLYFVMHTQEFDAGCMITASHNPKEYNGVKICVGTDLLWGPDIAAIKELFKRTVRARAGVSRGSVYQCAYHDHYISWLARHFEHIKNTDQSLIFDAGNGAAGTIIPALIQELGMRNALLQCMEVDGTYPHHNADPSVEENMADAKITLQQTAAQCAIAFDGDGDRMGAMTKNGRLVPGDVLLALFAQAVLAQQPGRTIVCDIKTSQAIITFIETVGGHVVISPTGHAHVKDHMRRKHGLLGGELSCHFLFADRYFGFDDGIYAALRLIELLVQTNQTLEQLVQQIPHMYSSPEMRLTCGDQQKQHIISALQEQMKKRHDIQLVTIDGIKITFAYGWAVLRAANTEPAISLRLESQTAQGLLQLKHEFNALLTPYIDQSVLYTHFGA